MPELRFARVWMVSTTDCTEKCGGFAGKYALSQLYTAVGSMVSNMTSHLPDVLYFPGNVEVVTTKSTAWGWRQQIAEPICAFAATSFQFRCHRTRGVEYMSDRQSEVHWAEHQCQAIRRPVGQKCRVSCGRTFNSGTTLDGNDVSDAFHQKCVEWFCETRLGTTALEITGVVFLSGCASHD
jgi:hypothetical protein